MKFVFILLTATSILPDGNIYFDSNQHEYNIKPYSQPLPEENNFIIENEPSIDQNKYFVGIDPIITGSNFLFN